MKYKPIILLLKLKLYCTDFHETYLHIHTSLATHYLLILLVKVYSDACVGAIFLKSVLASPFQIILVMFEFQSCFLYCQVIRPSASDLQKIKIRLFFYLFEKEDILFPSYHFGTKIILSSAARSRGVFPALFLMLKSAPKLTSTWII